MKISTYDFVRYGGLDGEVRSVAPDTAVDANGTPYFEVIVETDKPYLGSRAGMLPITPGMQATVDITPAPARSWTISSSPSSSSETRPSASADRVVSRAGSSCTRG